MHEELKSDLKKFIVLDLRLEDVAPEAIDDEAPLFGEGLELDSLDAVELAVVVHKRFGVSIKDMEEARLAFASVSALAAYIAARRAEG